MMWSFEKMYFINTLKQEFSTAKNYEYKSLDEMSVVDKHRRHTATNFLMRIIANIPMSYWLHLNSICDHIKVSKGTKIRNRYNQVPHLTQDTNWKVTNSQ